MAAPNITDYATSLVDTPPSPATSGTTLIITTGEGTYFPSSGSFSLVLHPSDELPTKANAEQVTATRTGDTFTITRAQNGTTAKTIVAGWRVSLGILSEHITGAYDRANHTGSQAISTVTGLQTALDGKSDTSHNHDSRYYTETEVDTALSGKQDVDSDLTAIAGLSPSNDDILQRKAGAWTNRTPAQVKNDLSLTKSDVGLSNVPNTDATDRANHTGTQTASTISDFNTAADARISAAAGVSVASLSGGKVPTSQLPAVSLTTVQTAASQVAQLALTTQEGDIVVRTDENKTYMRNSGTAGDMTDFTLLNTPTDAVTSVNGQTGIVVLAKSDVGLGNVDNTSDANKPISTATQTALDAKVAANGAITGATKTKITYDAKGLVTGGADATQDDIGDGTTYKQYSATDKTKLAGIEAGADVTDATNVAAAGAVMESDTSTASMSFVIDEDDMSSDSATKIPTQQSVKAYVDNNAGGATTPRMVFSLVDREQVKSSTDAGQTQYTASGVSSQADFFGLYGIDLMNGTTTTGYGYAIPSNQRTGLWLPSKLLDMNPTIFGRVAIHKNTGMKSEFGIGGDGQARWSSSNKGLCFRAEATSGALALYAVACNGSAETATDITTAASATTGWNTSASLYFQNYAIVYTSGTEAAFYINGTLMTTITTNLPTGAMTGTGDQYIISARCSSNASTTASSRLSVSQLYVEYNVF